MGQNPFQKISTFQIKDITRINIDIPIKGKKMYHIAIQLLTSDTSKSLIKELDTQSMTSRNKSDKSLSYLSIDKKLEDIYNEILEQSLIQQYELKTVYNIL